MLEELLVGVTVAFVGYFLYNVYRTVSETNSAGQQPVAAEAAPAVEAPAASAPEAAAEAAPAADSAEAAADEKVITLRNPDTGETTPVPTSYRFAKKWVKEALVSEGLLPKVYKNSELQGGVNDKVKEAMESFKNLEKYQG